MLFGFVDANGASINTEDDAILNCTYYFGTNDDGARHSGWLRYEDGFDTTDYDDYDYEYYWFNFDSTGKKRANTEKKINGERYYFDPQGVMITEWANSTWSTTSKYFNANLENGSLETNAWVWAEPNYEEWGLEDDGSEHWFRTNNKGILITGVTKKINSKWYVFDENGIMQYGLVVLNNTDKETGETKYSVSGATFDYAINEDNTDASTIYDIEDGMLFYFSNNEETDGAMKTGSSINISLADDDYVFGFHKTTGEALCGVENNKVYRNGIRQEADDDKYAVVLGGRGDDVYEYLVNSTGTRMKAKKYYKDDNDEYYVVVSENGYYNDEGKFVADGDNYGYVIEHVPTLEDAKALLAD